MSPPDRTAARPVSHPWWDLRVVDDVDFEDPDQVGPPEVAVWSRFRDVPADASASQALLSFASDGFLIATAMRPHKGVGQALAHVTISTTVTAQTLSFHEPFRADEWLLLAHHSPYAGRGRPGEPSTPRRERRAPGRGPQHCRTDTCGAARAGLLSAAKGGTLMTCAFRLSLRDEIQYAAPRALVADRRRVQGGHHGLPSGAVQHR